MAKELPYFKFEPSEWMSGDISFLTMSAQGVFINICCLYWQRLGDLTKDQVLRRINDSNIVNLLLNEGIIKEKENRLVIEFLDLQLDEFKTIREINSENGRKGGRPKKTETKPTAFDSLKRNETETKAIRGDKRIIIYKGGGDNYKLFVQFINSTLSREFKGDKKSQKQFNARIKEGFTDKDFEKAIVNASKDLYHIENQYKYLTPEFFTRPDKIERFKNQLEKKKELTLDEKWKAQATPDLYTK